jgi:hypothetical protein
MARILKPKKRKSFSLEWEVDSLAMLWIQILFVNMIISLIGYVELLMLTLFFLVILMLTLVELEVCIDLVNSEIQLNFLILKEKIM